jgi:hypothetical protein
MSLYVVRKDICSLFYGVLRIWTHTVIECNIFQFRVLKLVQTIFCTSAAVWENCHALGTKLPDSWPRVKLWAYDGPETLA